MEIQEVNIGMGHVQRSRKSAQENPTIIKHLRGIGKKKC